MSEIRGGGFTKRQMEEAPKDAVYVWCNHCLDYPKHLARFIKREDLKIVPPDWITNERWQGQTLTGLVVDHATWSHLSPRSRFTDFLRHAQTRIRVNPNSASG